MLTLQWEKKVYVIRRTLNVETAIYKKSEYHTRTRTHTHTHTHTQMLGAPPCPPSSLHHCVVFTYLGIMSFPRTTEVMKSLE